MKKSLITATTIFALSTSSVFAAGNGMDFNNAFAYSKSTQSGSIGSAQSADSSNSFGVGTGFLIFLVAVIAVAVIVGNSGSDDNHYYSMRK